MTEVTGTDNYGRPKTEYVEKISNMNDAELKKEASHRIWLSAYANNNPRADYHWQVDLIYDECVKRKNTDIYKQAYDDAFDK